MSVSAAKAGAPAPPPAAPPPPPPPASATPLRPRTTATAATAATTMPRSAKAAARRSRRPLARAASAATTAFFPRADSSHSNTGGAPAPAADEAAARLTMLARRVLRDTPVGVAAHAASLSLAPPAGVNPRGVSEMSTAAKESRGLSPGRDATDSRSREMRRPPLPLPRFRSDIEPRAGSAQRAASRDTP